MKPFLIGLTGSIGMGKSTTAQMFRDEGLPVWDADAAVHRLYSQGGAAVAPLSALLPAALIEGAISRDVLKQEIAADPAILGQIEAIVHPLVRADREAFIVNSDAKMVVLDIPLLFETKSEAQMDAIIVVSTSAETQKERVLARGTMSEAQFNAIRAKQMPDVEKRERADYIIQTQTLEGARAQLRDILQDIRRTIDNA